MFSTSPGFSISCHACPLRSVRGFSSNTPEEIDFTIHLFKRAQSVGLKSSDDSIFFPVTQQHLSDALGLSLAHTNRCLRKLAKAGLYSLNEGRLQLKKPATLRELADYFQLPLHNRPLI